MNGRTLCASDQSVEKAVILPTGCRNQDSRELDPANSDNAAEKHRLGPNGTGRAIDLSPSVASSPARRWGGRRNSASRISDSLSLHQAANIIAAAQFAAAAGMPFNRHLTIHWQQAGVTDHRAAWATGRFLKVAGDWIAKRGGRFAWAWVRENGERKGSHVHILLHLPAGTQIGGMQRRWLRLITGLPYCASTIKTARIGGTADAAQSAPNLYAFNLAAVVSYLLKGACAEAAREMRLTRLEPSGRIVGKRAATSQNVARAARRELTQFNAREPAAPRNNAGRATQCKYSDGWETLKHRSAISP